MPYIKQIPDREELENEAHLKTLSNYLASRDIKNFAGYLNYTIFRIVKEYITKNGKKYFTFAVIIGTIVCCVLEIYRKLVSPYEELKEKENGRIE